MKNTIYNWSLSLVILLFFGSCEKVIPIKLDNSDKQIVIEGEITIKKEPYFVRISSTKNFDENNDFPGRTDALVIITDLSTGKAEKLVHTCSGVYQTSTLQGVAGHTYQLDVTVDGKNYKAQSTIPMKVVKIDKLSIRSFELDTDKKFIVPEFTDPKGEVNFYRLRQWINGVLVKGSWARNDEAADGRVFDTPFYYDTSDEAGNPLIKDGDEVTVELQCVDKGVYDYFRTLSETIEQEAAAPANPLSNISGGALGYFNACRTFKVTSTIKL